MTSTEYVTAELDAANAASILHERINRDRQTLDTLTLQCCECQRYGPAHDGLWNLVSGLVYCEACQNQECTGAGD